MLDPRLVMLIDSLSSLGENLSSEDKVTLKSMLDYWTEVYGDYNLVPLNTEVADSFHMLDSLLREHADRNRLNARLAKIVKDILTEKSED